MYPGPTDEAFEARRHFSAITFQAPNTETFTGKLQPGTGLVLPQHPNGPHIIHDITPTNPKNPGEFIKLAVPSSDEEAVEELTSRNYVTLDELITRGLSEFIPDKPIGIDSILPVIETAKTTARRGRRAMAKRPCKLD
jgi:hypothetical protein